MTTERTDVERARAQVADTLSAIEYKLNVPKRTAERVRRLREQNPLVLVGAAAAVAAAVGGVIWLAVRAAQK